MPYITQHRAYFSQSPGWARLSEKGCIVGNILMPVSNGGDMLVSWWSISLVLWYVYEVRYLVSLFCVSKRLRSGYGQQVILLDNNH